MVERPSIRIPWRKPEGIVITFSEPVMDAVRTFVTVAGPRLLRVRSARDVRALVTDRELIKALATDLEPLVEGVLTQAIAHPLPVQSRWAGHASVSVASAVGAGAGTSAEIATIFAPEAVGLSIPTALTVQVVTFAGELYVELSTVVHRLREAGIEDPEIIQETLLGSVIPGGADVTQLFMVRATERLARRLLLRIAAEWVPVAGILAAVVSSNLDMARVNRAADRAVADARLALPAVTRPA